MMTALKITIASQAKNIYKYKTQKGKYLIDFNWFDSVLFLYLRILSDLHKLCLMYAELHASLLVECVLFSSSFNDSWNVVTDFSKVPQYEIL
jgi:hypothetical protein